MDVQPEILSSAEMLDKYYESKVESSLHLFKKIETFCSTHNRRTETYKDPTTRRKVLVRHFFKQADGSEKMTVTFLFHQGKRYMADRISVTFAPSVPASSDKG